MFLAPGYGFVALAASPFAAFLAFVASVRYICCFPSVSLFHGFVTFCFSHHR